MIILTISLSSSAAASSIIIISIIIILTYNSSNTPVHPHTFGLATKQKKK
jgi:hypothetical protein